MKIFGILFLGLLVFSFMLALFVGFSFLSGGMDAVNLEFRNSVSSAAKAGLCVMLIAPVMQFYPSRVLALQDVFIRVVWHFALFLLMQICSNWVEHSRFGLGELYIWLKVAALIAGLILVWDVLRLYVLKQKIVE